MPFIGHIPVKKRCLDPEHEPPGMIVLEPGTHTYQCPSCGQTSSVYVPEVGL